MVVDMLKIEKQIEKKTFWTKNNKTRQIWNKIV